MSAIRQEVKAVSFLFQLVQLVTGGEVWRGGSETQTASNKRAHVPLGGDGLSLPVSLALSVELQRFDNSIFNGFRGRPRCEILADAVPGYPHMFLLIWFFFLHDGQDHILI